MAQHPILERYLWFDGQIRRGRYPNASDLARNFELCNKTAQRDIAFFRDRLNAPLEYDHAQRGYRYGDESFTLPPIFATEGQLLALIMARRLLEAGGGPLDRDLEDFANTLFSNVTNRRLDKKRFDQLFSAVWSGNSPAAEAIFRTVLSSLTQDRLLRILYTSPRNNERTDRTVEPHHLQHYQGSWVLLAWCRRAGNWRKFFLSRMEQAKALPEGFQPRPRDLWKPQLEGGYGIFQGKECFTVRLRFCAERARWIRHQKWHEKQRTVLLPNGCLELHLPVTDLREIRLKVLQFGADVEVLEPEELRESIREEIERMCELYDRSKKTTQPVHRMPFKFDSVLIAAD